MQFKPMLFKGHCVYTSGILFIHKKEGNLAICDNMDGP